IPCLADAIAGKERCAGSRLIQRILVDCLDKQPEECVAHLTRLLTDRRKSSREAAHYAAKQIGPGAKAAIPALTKALADKEVRFEVACALAYIAGPDAKAAVPVLSEKGRLNSDSLAALEKIGPGAKAAVPALIEFLKQPKADGDFSDKMSAVAILGS